MHQSSPLILQWLLSTSPGLLLCLVLHYSSGSMWSVGLPLWDNLTVVCIIVHLHLVHSWSHLLGFWIKLICIFVIPIRSVWFLIGCLYFFRAYNLIQRSVIVNGLCLGCSLSSLDAAHNGSFFFGLLTIIISMTLNFFFFSPRTAHSNYFCWHIWIFCRFFP